MHHVIIHIPSRRIIVMYGSRTPVSRANLCTRYVVEKVTTKAMQSRRIVDPRAIIVTEGVVSLRNILALFEVYL